MQKLTDDMQKLKLECATYAKGYENYISTCIPTGAIIITCNIYYNDIHFFRYQELKEMVLKGGGDNAITRHTQRNKKVLVRQRLRMLLDSEDYLELSPFAGLDLEYGDIPSAGCVTGASLKDLFCSGVLSNA